MGNLSNQNHHHSWNTTSMKQCSRKRRNILHHYLNRMIPMMIDDSEDDDINNDNNTKKKTKKKQKWIDVKPVKGNVRVVLGETQEQMWKQAQNEIEDVESMILNKCGSNKPQLKDLVNLLFGKKEKISLLFEQDLGWTYTRFCQFIATMA